MPTKKKPLDPDKLPDGAAARAAKKAKEANRKKKAYLDELMGYGGGRRGRRAQAREDEKPTKDKPKKKPKKKKPKKKPEYLKN